MKIETEDINNIIQSVVIENINGQSFLSIILTNNYATSRVDGVGFKVYEYDGKFLQCMILTITTNIFCVSAQVHVYAQNIHELCLIDGAKSSRQYDGKVEVFFTGVETRHPELI